MTAPTPVYGHRSTAALAEVREIDGRSVSWFSLDGGKHRGAIGTPEGETIVRAARLAVELGMPIVGRIASSGADVTEGLSALHACGAILPHLRKQVRKVLTSAARIAISASPGTSGLFVLACVIRKNWSRRSPTFPRSARRSSCFRTR